MNKWQAQIRIEEKVRRIGYYENEEEAATDYARAVFKYKGQGALGKAREQDSFIIDLSDVPPQLPIPKSAGRIKEGASKYKGVSLDKPTNKWLAQISIDGKQRRIGYYENEEEGGADYARAVFKYKNQAALGKAREQDSFIIDLSDVPPQSPISKSEGRIKEGASKYTGVSFDKRMNKWQAKIHIDGKNRLIGYYENEEEAAVDYARAVFKYKNQAALGKAREDSFIIDLSDVPPQPPIPKSSGTIKEGASKYTGVHFNKQMNKWRVQIDIKGKNRLIGYYENEEEAAVDYARAVFKYKNQGALGKAREDSFIIDLSGVPPQPPIPKSSGTIKEGASKYTGVHFNKQMNKWRVQIDIKGKLRTIGYYENEEEAAVDYARAVFKYKGQAALDKARERRALDNAREQDSIIIDLSGVPPQSPITKSAGLIKEGASKYTGVTFHKRTKKWQAQIFFEGKQRHIGCYENEEDAAVDYARAVFKYRGQGALDNAREQRARDTSMVDAFTFDLTDVPPQPPVPKSAGHINEGASKYTGVSFDKRRKKWEAQIMIDGNRNNRHIGYYENEEEAAVDYARAVFKYKGQGALDKAREQDSIIIDLSDVPPQPPIPKSKGRIKEGASKYTGVHFSKQMNKWHAQIRIEEKARFIGSYENEEAAAVDYARAVFKYKGQGALGRARERRALGKVREQNSIIIDLTGVPQQSPIPKSEGRIKEGASKYTGVSFNKKVNKWQAQIMIDGKQNCIGRYESEEAAAVDYARAVFKYKGQGALGRARERRGLFPDIQV
eukprot:scaffold2384_cov150-Skeletonema_marinoi.AAC.1